MSYGKIFSVVTEHTASTVTARYAISLASACKAELILYSAYDGRSNEKMLLHTERHLEHLFAIAFEQGIRVARVTEAGELEKLLPMRVQAERGDLVFYPLTPHERYGAHLQRDPVHRLLRTIGCDLAVMRVVHMAKPHPRHILMPLGGAVPDGDRRLNFIAELARSFRAEVTLFHLTAGRGAPLPEEIARFRKKLQQQQVTVLERRGSGEIGRSITVEAIVRHNDLIVLGASERGVLRRVFFGNPAGDVMHHPPCNAVLFRPARST